MEGYLFDPRVAGGALVAAIFALGHFRSTSHGVSSISVTPSGTVDGYTSGESVNLFGVAVDQKGNDVADITLTWTSPGRHTASLDTTTGPKCRLHRSRRRGTPLITATGGGATARIPVTVKRRRSA